MTENKRLRLGVIFNFNPSWMGGVIYIINIVKTLNFLDDKDKPRIYLFYNPILQKFLNEMEEYPYLEKVEWNFPGATKGFFKSLILRKNLFISDILKKYSLDAVYPLQDFPVKTNTPAKLIFWRPDFQHKHYPEFFSRKVIMGRHLRMKSMMKNSRDLVLSSHDAYEDMKKFYKVPKGLNIYIFHFVSIIDDLQGVNIKELLSKYKLPSTYYLISNQFHKHKNHKVAFEAVAKLKQEGIRINLAITGRFPDASDSPYMNELHQILDDNQLHDQIIMLGIIPRNDQLQLMRHSQAVLQPSLFEGWSTVIEDARSLQVPVIAANLGVNIEQLKETGSYFDPHNVDELAEILKKYPKRDMNKKYYQEYEARVKEAAETLMNIFRL
jgi:glycosyltransferase involved in cell wall biosynthesis